jgi:apolipoprotein N-acyltransferase
MKQDSFPIPGSGASAPRSLPLLALLIGMISLVLSSPRFAIPLFAWIGPIAFLWYSRHCSIKRKWLWIYAALVVSGIVSAYEVFPMPLIIAVLFILIGSAKTLLVFILDRWLTKNKDGFITTLFFPAALVTLEFIDSMGGGGVWGSIANSQFDFSWFIQLVSITGLWGISFMIGWFGSVVVWAIERNQNNRPYQKGLFIYGGIFLVILVYGVLRVNRDILSGNNSVKLAGVTVPSFNFLETVYNEVEKKTVAINPRISVSSSKLQEINQALIPFIEQPDPLRFPKTMAALDKLYDSLFVLSQLMADQGAKIISWSEGNGFVLMRKQDSLIERGRCFAKENKVYLLMALAVIEPGKITAGKKFIENKAILVGPDGNIANVFHKNKPVPIVENSSPGDQLVPVITTEYGKISTSICYDADFPQLMRQLSKNKSDLLLLPSGDWYAISPYHSHMAVIRGIENGSAVFRQVSGGLSVASDYRGKITGSFDFYKEGDKRWITSVRIGRVTTVYGIIGDVVAYVCIVVVVLVMMYMFLSWGRRGSLVRG